MPRKYTEIAESLGLERETVRPFPLCWSGTHLYTNHIPEESVSVKIGLKRFYKMVDALCVEGVVGAAAVHVNGY